MRGFSKTVIVCLVMFMAAASGARSENTVYITSGTARGRAMAMGGAYHSMEDDLSAGFYNPGAFRMHAANDESPFRLFLNPVAPVVSLYDFAEYNRDFAVDDELTAEEALFALAHAVKGAAYTTPVIDAGFGLGEESFSTTTLQATEKEFFSIRNLSKRSFGAAFVNFKIAPPVSVGLSSTLHYHHSGGTNEFASGYIFGVLVKPNPKLNVGVAYNKAPDEFLNDRMELESIESETASGGISYYPDADTAVSIDLRNLNKENQTTSRQIHVGFERKVMERFAVRAGYYRKKMTKNDVFSAGFAILPLWAKVSSSSHTSRTDIFSYTVVLEENGDRKTWHMASLLLRF